MKLKKNIAKRDYADSETSKLDNTVINITDSEKNSAKNSLSESFASVYTRESNAKTIRYQLETEKTEERPAKKPANEFQKVETTSTEPISLAVMDTDCTPTNGARRNISTSLPDDLPTTQDRSRIISPLRSVNLHQYMESISPPESVANVTTHNRFEPLCELPAEEPATASTSAKNTASKPKSSTPKNPPTRQATPPPIVLVGRDNGKLVEALDQVTSGNFWIKNTANTVVLHTQNMQDYESAIRMLNNNHWPFHTYSAKGKKTHAFVLRGLTKNHTEPDILKFIKDNSNVDAEKVFKMRTQHAPLFLVITGPSWTTSKLQKVLPRILRTAVTWENRRSANPITQCRRCQTWGHSMGNCTRPNRCSKCAEKHPITDCTHTGPPKCANCGEQHRAFSRECPVYKSKLSQYYEKFPDAQTAKKTYVQAPPPAQSAWSPRTQQALVQAGLATQQTSSAPPASTAPPGIDPNMYNRNFPNAPGQRRGEPPQIASTAPSGGSMEALNALQGKWERINSLINLDVMLKTLDTYIALLETAKTPVELFNVSRHFFCDVLPAIRLTP